MDEQLTLALIAEAVLQLRRDMDALMDRLDEMEQGSSPAANGTFDDD